jgi:hypothetical protein
MPITRMPRCWSTIALALVVLITVAGFTPAQSTQNASKPQPEQPQYSPEELELLRGKFLELLDSVKELADLVVPDDVDSTIKLTKAKEHYEQMSLKELNAFRLAIDPSTMNIGIGEARATIADLKIGLQTFRAKKSRRGVTINSAGLPTREGPGAVCDAIVGSGRPSAAAYTAIEVVYTAAELVHALASRTCNQVAVLVVLGEGGGGNTSLACTIADGVLFVAKAIREAFRSCDNDFTKRTVDSGYDRLGHIHSDLESSVANDNTNKTTIVDNDNTNTTNIIANANANKGDVIVNANSNTTAITTAIANVQTAIINNANANKNELRDLILRTQIEADLAEPDSAVPVTLYMTPTANGGYLDLVQTILTQTLANIQAAGGDVSGAQSFLAQANAAKAAGQFKNAYALYRKAYKSAPK